jgi:hypothetical protein
VLSPSIFEKLSTPKKHPQSKMHSTAIMENIQTTARKSSSLQLTTTNLPFPPEKFTPFPRLPKELHLTIWHYASMIRRTIMLQPLYYAREDHDAIDGQYAFPRFFKSAPSKERKPFGTTLPHGKDQLLAHM